MKIAESYYVELTKGELSKVLSRVCFEKLRPIIPEIETKADQASITLRLIKHDPDFRLEFSCSIVSSEVDSTVTRNIVPQVFIHQRVVTDEIIKEVLLKKHIKQAANLNTPVKDLDVRLGSLNLEGEKKYKALSFSFSCNYDDISDHQ